MHIPSRPAAPLVRVATLATHAAHILVGHRVGALSACCANAAAHREGGATIHGAGRDCMPIYKLRLRAIIIYFVDTA